MKKVSGHFKICPCKLIDGTLKLNTLEPLAIQFHHPALVPAQEISIGELDLDALTRKYRKARNSFITLPKFPSVRRDIALIVDEETPADNILEEISKLGSKLIEDAQVFDVFTGSPVEKGKKSVAVSLQLRAQDKTLTEEEINKVQDKTIKKLQLALGADLRTIQ